MARKRKPLNHLRRRTSLYFHVCCVCLKRVEPGEDYYDGGHGRRAHIDCGDAEEVKPDLEKPRAEQDAVFEADPYGTAERSNVSTTDRLRTPSDCAPCPRRCVQCPDPPDHHWYSAYAELEPDHPAAKAGRTVWLVCKHDEQCDAWIDVPEDYDGI